jgi:hypothetical protein
MKTSILFLSRFLFAASTLALAGLLGIAHAQAQAPDDPRCGKKPDCVLDTLWPDPLPEAVYERRGLARAFLSAAELSGSPELVFVWGKRTGEKPLPASADFGLERARGALATLPADGVRQAAADRADPWFAVGRIDVMVGIWRLSRDPVLRMGLVEDLRAIAAEPNAGTRRRPTGFTDTASWERHDAGFALARIGLYACDEALVREGAALSGRPDDVRFTIWLAHATGIPASPASLFPAAADAPDEGKDKRAREAASEADFDRRRAAVEAYGETWASGACNG